MLRTTAPKRPRLQVEREMRLARSRLMQLDPNSRAYRSQKLRLEALVVEYGLSHGAATFAAGAL